MIAYLNGHFVDHNELQLSPYDSGFVLGITIAEQLRTFHGNVFQLDRHLARMRRGVEEIGIAEQIPFADLPDIVHRVVQKNFDDRSIKNDLGVTVFVTPGIYPTYAPDETPTPTIAVHTYPLPFQFWSNKYATGQDLVVVNVQQISPHSWPPHIKCRSRMHYFLADRKAKEISASAAALLLDENQCLSETPIANIILHLPGEGLVSPSKERILPGVSLEYVVGLAHQLDIPFRFRDISLHEISKADEILLSSTPYCLLSVASVKDHDFRREQPGPLYRALCEKWIRDVDCDFIDQARVQALR